jgi:hypothetical protein
MFRLSLHMSVANCSRGVSLSVGVEEPSVMGPLSPCAWKLLGLCTHQGDPLEAREDPPCRPLCQRHRQRISFLVLPGVVFGGGGGCGTPFLIRILTFVPPGNSFPFLPPHGAVVCSLL